MTVFGPFFGILGIFPFKDIESFIFVRDGIHSVADYNLTLMGVVVVVVAVVVVYLFRNGIT